MKLRTTNDLLATDKGSLIIYCQDLHIEIERMRTDSTRYWRNRVEQAVAAEREACADAESDAGRLALELECLLQSISDMPTVSRWWESANEALDLHRSRLDAIRASGAKGGE